MKLRYRKIPYIGEALEKSLRRGEIRLAVFANDALCWAVKNQVREVRWFSYSCQDLAYKFSESKSFRY